MRQLLYYSATAQKNVEAMFLSFAPMQTSCGRHSVSLEWKQHGNEKWQQQRNCVLLRLGNLIA